MHEGKHVSGGRASANGKGQAAFSIRTPMLTQQEKHKVFWPKLWRCRQKTVPALLETEEI